MSRANSDYPLEFESKCGGLLVSLALGACARSPDSCSRTRCKLIPFVSTNIRVRLPTLNEEIGMPYGYQNGRFNLIKPVEFTQKNEALVRNAACKTAMEGLALYRHPDPKFGDLQLVVIAEFNEKNPGSASMVRDIFGEVNVQMFTPENLDSLKQEILTHGKPLPASGELFG